MKTLTVVFRIDDPTGGSLAFDMIERISPGVRPVAYAWGHLMDENNALKARLAEEVKDRDHWKALAESLSYPMPD